MKLKSRHVTLAIAVIAVIAISYMWLWHSHRYDLPYIKQHNAWFVKRFNPDVPLYLLPSNAQDILAKIPDARQRDAAKAALERLTAPAIKTEAAFPHQHPITCAVVGSSGNLLGSNYGSIIDAHTIIFRMNNAPTIHYEKDVGTRTTYNVLISTRPDVKVYDNQTISIIYIDYIDINYSKPQDIQKYNARIATDLQWLTTQMLPGIFPPIAPFRIFPSNLFELSGGVYIVNPEFMQYIFNRWVIFKNNYKYKYDVTSSGFKALILALHLCDQVDVFGFGTNAHNKQKQFWDHYFNPGGNKYYALVHDLNDYQEKFLKTLEQQGIIRIYPGNIERDTIDGKP